MKGESSNRVTIRPGFTDGNSLYISSEEYFSVDQVELLVSREALRVMTLRSKRTLRSSGVLAR